MATGGTAAIHSICPVKVHIKGERVISESTGSISIRFPYKEAEYDCVSFTRFVFRLERVNDEWKLLTLDGVYDRDTITLHYLISAVDAPIPEGRESYKCISWVLAQKGFKITQNLPGTDTPGACTKLTKEVFTGLNE